MNLDYHPYQKEAQHADGQMDWSSFIEIGLSMTRARLALGIQKGI